MISLQNAGIKAPYDCEGFEAYLGDEKPFELWGSTPWGNLMIHKHYMNRYLEYRNQGPRKQKRQMKKRRKQNALQELLMEVIPIDDLCELVRSYLGFLGKWDMLAYVPIFKAERFWLAAVDEPSKRTWLWDYGKYQWVRHWRPDDYLWPVKPEDHKIMRDRILTEDGTPVTITKTGIFLNHKMVAYLGLPASLRNAVQSEDGTVYALLTPGWVIKVS